MLGRYGYQSDGRSSDLKTLVYCKTGPETRIRSDDSLKFHAAASVGKTYLDGHGMSP